MPIKGRYKRDVKPARNVELEKKVRNRQKSRKARGKSTEIRAPRRRYPKNLERIYRKELLRFVSALKEAVDKIVIPRIPSIINELNFNRPDSMDVRIDQVDSFRAALDAQITENFSNAELDTMVRRTGGNVNQASREAMKDSIKSVIGVDPLLADQFVAGELQLFAVQNVQLIKSIQTKYFDDIEGLVFRGAQRGETAAQIGEGITKRTGATVRRAELIARDQVASLNGQLDQLRQKSVGVEEYIWRTVGDERVREEHADREGQKYKWSDPPHDGHPGEPINCRCVAEPVVSSILD